MQIHVFDTTLRDGTQSEGLSLTVDDKLKIARLLDRFGVHFIEGGYPASNPKDADFFRRARTDLGLTHATLTAFGSTRRPGTAPQTDAGLRALVDAGTPAVCIFGKSWTLHVTQVLATDLRENLNMARESVAFLKAAGKEVIYDAEHFFDGYRADPEYALSTLRAAAEAGADWIVLCDTNGGSLPDFVAETVRRVRRDVSGRLGIHSHNDADMAVANTLAAVEAGCTQVQGTINGWGERCGNANLISVIPALQLKLGRRCVPDEQLARLTELSRAVSEIANIRPRAHAPYVGSSAFAHKGGVHVAAVEKVPASYEHIAPERVGNRRKVVVSELSGRGNVRVRSGELGANLRGQERQVLDIVKSLEAQGYQFESAEGSFELIARRMQPGYRTPFEVLDVVVIAKRSKASTMPVEAIVKLKLGNEVLHTVADGAGPVHALDRAFHKGLDAHYPSLRQVQLCDYKVRILDPEAGAQARARVLVECAERGARWSTIGVSANIIEASCQALGDALELPLARAQTVEPAARTG